MPKVFIVIAAYNEQHAISQVVRDLRSSGYKNVIVVDDGSADKTSSVAKKAGAMVVRHPLNRGQGAALKTGMDYALMNGADVIVNFDADGQHRVEDLPAMINPIINKKVDITLGSRFLKPGSNVPPIRKFFLKSGAVLFNILYGVKLTDSHNGFRAFSRKAAQTIKITADKMEHASEIISEIGKHKFKYREIPVVIQYTEYSKAHSAQGMFPAIKIFLKTIGHKFLR